MNKSLIFLETSSLVVLMDVTRASLGLHTILGYSSKGSPVRPLNEERYYNIYLLKYSSMESKGTMIYQGSYVLLSFLEHNS